MRKLLACAVVALFAADVHGCDCSTGSVESGMDSADLVFGANVISATVKGAVVEIEVDGIAPLKGDTKSLKKITTNVGKSACGFLISVPERYVFFTNAKGEFNRCGATRLLTDPGLGVLTSKVIRIWRSGSD